MTMSKTWKIQLNEEEWNESILKLFDSALCDVFVNLEYCMTRFRAYYTFQDSNKNK